MTRIMLKTKKPKTVGQSIAEYGILISVVTVALLAMQIYMRRGIQAAVKYSTDQFGNQDYLPDAKDARITDVDMWSESYSEFELLQEDTTYGVETIYKTSETSKSYGNSTYFINDTF